jgi:hypothetical protein
VLRAAYQAGNGDRGGHLTDREWEQLACAEMDDAAKTRALSHAVSCPTCSTIHRSLIALAEGATAFDPASKASVTNRAFAWRPWAVGGGLAAAALIVLAVMIDNPSRDRQPSNVTRTNVEGATITVTRSLSLPDRRLAWTAVPNADRYEVRISDATGALLWTTRLTTDEAEVPAQVALSRGTYYLQISASRDGTTIGSSSLVPIQVD